MSGYLCDHDLHTHTFLSACSKDEGQTAEAVLQSAKKNGLRVQAITDHVWDKDVLGASAWYAPQDIAHAKRNLPLKAPDGVRAVFGCETEFLGGEKLGLSLKHFNEFSFVIIPPNHFHMQGFVRPECVTTPEQIAALLVERLEEIAALPLPFYKVGIAHMTTALLDRGKDKYAVMDAVNKERFFDVMRAFQKLGAGVELNAACFGGAWLERAEEELALYRIAKEAGCKFFLGSDAHQRDKLMRVPAVLPEVVARLELKETDKFLLREAGDIQN